MLLTILHKCNGAADITKKSAKSKNLQDVRVSSPIGATCKVPSGYWCYLVSCTNIGATLPVSLLVLERKYGQNWQKC
jgi:hypothetical protein